MKNLDALTTAYLVCALWAETDNSDERGGKPLDSNYGISDFSDTAIEKAIKDCKQFQDMTMDSREKSGLSAAQIGHDFLLTINSHGVNFKDRMYGVNDEQKLAILKLYEVAKSFAAAYVEVGDDKKLYLY